MLMPFAIAAALPSIDISQVYGFHRLALRAPSARVHPRGPFPFHTAQIWYSPSPKTGFTMSRMNTSRFSRRGVFAGALLFACTVHTPAQTPAAASQTASAAPNSISCPVRTTPLSPGEIALVQHDLPKAETLLQDE